MKSVFIITISIIFAFPLCAQYSSLGKIDTVTTGESDDASPVLVHGTFDGVFSRSYRWLILGRNTENSSEIVGKKFFLEDAVWDSSIVVISPSPVPMSQRNPDISGIPYPLNNFSHLAAWERRENSVWNIYYSRFMDNDTTWTPSQPLTQDTVDNTNVQIRPLSDSSFIAIWKRKSALLYSFANSMTISSPETIAVSTSDSLEYDFISQYGSGSLVWTSRDTTAKNIMIFRSFETYPSFALTTPETLFCNQSAFNPRFSSMYYGTKSVFFETVINGNHEVMIREGYSNPGDAENISNDSLADDRNPRTFTSPIVTKRGIASKKSYFSYYGVFTMEKYISTDSMLIFSVTNYLADTMKSAGYNRNICIGSNMFTVNGKLSVLTVWESNRTGRSHIYSRLVGLPMDGVEPPIISPSFYKLGQNYPNPFNPITNIQFTMAHSEFVSLKVFDLLGREVTTIVDENLTPGVYERQWDAGNFASGIYFYRLQAGSFTETKKLMLLK